MIFHFKEVVFVFHCRVSGTDCGDEVSEWLAEALGRPGCRLIQQACDDERQSKLKDAGGCQGGDWDQGR